MLAHNDFVIWFTMHFTYFHQSGFGSRSLMLMKWPLFSLHKVLPLQLFSQRLRSRAPLRHSFPATVHRAEPTRRASFSRRSTMVSSSSVATRISSSIHGRFLGSQISGRTIGSGSSKVLGPTSQSSLSRTLRTWLPSFTLPRVHSPPVCSRVRHRLRCTFERH